jgi:hypothetical protein
MVQFPIHCSSWVLLHPRSVTPIVATQKTQEQPREHKLVLRQEEQRSRFYAQA